MRFFGSNPGIESKPLAIDAPRFPQPMMAIFTLVIIEIIIFDSFYYLKVNNGVFFLRGSQFNHVFISALFQ
jgi:hypothetical protein